MFPHWLYAYGTTEVVLICIVLFCILALIVWGLAYRFGIRPRQLRHEEIYDEWRNDSYRDDYYEERADDDYVAMLHTASQERLVPAFHSRPVTDIPLPGDTAVLVAMTPPMTNEELAMELEKDDYLTGRTLRILRKEREVREGWHWDELTGEWQVGRDFAESLDYDDWLRKLLEDREEVVAA